MLMILPQLRRFMKGAVALQQLVVDRRDHAIHPHLIGCVRLDRNHVPTRLGSQGGRGLLQDIRAPRRDDDMSPLLRQSSGYRVSDSGATASDDGNAVGKVESHVRIHLVCAA